VAMQKCLGGSGNWSSERGTPMQREPELSKLDRLGKEAQKAQAAHRGESRTTYQGGLNE
jgi:hypothetical protein